MQSQSMDVNVAANTSECTIGSLSMQFSYLGVVTVVDQQGESVQSH